MALVNAVLIINRETNNEDDYIIGLDLTVGI